jgi:hypothetical protein
MQGMFQMMNYPIRMLMLCVNNTLINLDLMGDDNPCFLEEMQFIGFAPFEWRYLGLGLNEEEVLQVIGSIQNYMSLIRY